VQTATQGPIAFDIQGLSYAYDRLSALQSVTLQVRQGERIALLGANGSGKSTLLRLLAGLAFPQRGSLAFFGEELTRERMEDEQFSYSFRRRLGFLFQNPDVQLFNASVFDEVAFAPLQMRLPKTQLRKRVEEALEQMGISELRDRAPHRLSGGEKKRVALASVLVLDPEVLILDEPTAALDPQTQNQIVELIGSWRGGTKTVITATHSLDTLEEVADRCYVLRDGSLVGEGEPMAVLHDVGLLERSRLLRPHRHVHQQGAIAPHPHVHWGEQEN
jgi:cobalt/nickel transport system ATP-binding protein